jgi:addiction module HigA family antidote
MAMHNPPHPGSFIKDVYMEPYELSVRKVAGYLGVSPSTFSRLVNGDAAVTPEMALRLSKVLGRSPDSWLAMQNQYDLWQAGKHVKLGKVKRAPELNAA